MLTPKQIAFCREYVVDFNATQAAIRAGYSETSAHVSGWQTLQNINACNYIAELQERAATVAKLDAAFVVEQWMQIATADPNEISQVQRTCCHYCYGVGHKYQWTEATYRAEVGRTIKAGLTPPDGLGGYGFDARREPNPNCPECNGVGVETIHFADTRKLRGASKRLYAGVKVTKSGIEVQTRDQDAALKNLAAYLGILVDKKELSGPGGRPITTVGLKAGDLDDDQLAAIITGNATEFEESGGD
jgi:hypothetical protein